MNRIFLIALVWALSFCVPSVTGNRRKFFRLAKCFNDTYSAAETQTCLGNVSTCFDDSTISTVKTCIQDGIAEAKANAPGNNSTDNGSGGRLLGSHNAGGGGGNGGGNQGGGGNGGGGQGGGLGSAAGNRTGFGSGFRPQKKGKMGKLAGIVQGCLETQKECIKQEVRAFIKNKLPACVNTTASALGECFKTNAETCSESCSESDIPTENPFSSVQSTNVKACSGFQNQIMNPACGIVDCCSECQSEFDALMTCVGQDLLKLKPEPCELTCPASSGRRRRLLERNLAGHIAAAPEAATIADECAIYLDTEEETLTADAVTEKILEGEFIGCVADVAILVAEEQKEFDSTHGGGTSAATSIYGMTTTVTGLAAFFFLGLLGLM